MKNCAVRKSVGCPAFRRAGPFAAESRLKAGHRTLHHQIGDDLRICTLPSARYFVRMSKVTKLLHTRYRVNDLERTIKFYRDVLGLKEIQRHKSPRGSELVFLKAPESDEQIEICSFPAGGLVQVQPDLTHLAFEVDNLEEFGKHLAKHGLKYSDGPTTTSTGTVFAFIDAPEGYEIELIQKGKGSY
jgi:lactoylglutathione lyase